MSKIINVNSSLAYEILLYLNSFYIGMFIVCEVAIGILKACNMNYSENELLTEAGVFGLLCLVEVIRIYLGRKGDLECRRLPIFFSTLLTIPSAIGVCYFMVYQAYILRLEYIWCAVMLIFQALELAFTILYMERDVEYSLYAFLGRVRLNVALDALRRVRCVARSADRARVTHALLQDAVRAHHRRSVFAKQLCAPVLRTYGPTLDDYNMTGQNVKVYSILPKDKPKPRDEAPSS